MTKPTLFTRRVLGTTLLAIAAGPALCLSAAAQSWPTKPVKIVVNFPPGGAADQIARAVGIPLAEALGQPVVIENRGGANGNLGGDMVAKSAPDGHTLLFSSNSAAASNVALLKSIPYDPLKDFTPVAAVGENMLVLMVKTDHPAKNIQEFINYAKQRPGKVNAGYGSSSSQVSIAVLNKLGKVDTSKSIGAKARVISTLAAIMAPGLISPTTTNHAPAPKLSDCCE